MKLYSSLMGVVDIRHPQRGIEQLKEAGFVGVVIDYDALEKQMILVDAYEEQIEHICDALNMDLLRVGEKEISLQAEKRSILMKNQARCYHGHFVRGTFSNPDEIVSYIEQKNHMQGNHNYDVCLDVGVCNLCGQNMYDFVKVLGHRLKAIILRDNDGNSDDHLLPFSCAHQNQSKIDWLNLIRGLRELEFDGDLIMSIGDSVMASPVTLRADVIQMAYKQAKYFQWQIQMTRVMRRYENRVLFGAGNMCRNYLKCYGQEFPPLFTCENNESRWGEIFEGVEVCSPEKLKELSSDCAIFICNMYYDEIERQLLEMGIRNPIERFSDEFMPSFYWKRLDMWEG